MPKEFPDEDELVLCTVTKIAGTTVFVHIDSYNKDGMISTSEIAPGRIRNIRDYVNINKKVVCKIIRIDKAKGHIDLSLRRVSNKDSREIIDEYKKEQTTLLILKMILNESAVQVAEKIKEKYPLKEFLEKIRQTPDVLKEFVSEKEAEQISNLINERIKEKIFRKKAILSISSTAPNGLSIIKTALMSAKNAKIAYLGAPNYSLMIESKNLKDAEKKFKDTLDMITEKIKKEGGKIEVKEA